MPSPLPRRVATGERGSLSRAEFMLGAGRCDVMSAINIDYALKTIDNGGFYNAAPPATILRLFKCDAHGNIIHQLIL